MGRGKIVVTFAGKRDRFPIHRITDPSPTFEETKFEERDRSSNLS